MPQERGVARPWSGRGSSGRHPASRRGRHRRSSGQAPPILDALSPARPQRSTGFGTRREAAQRGPAALSGLRIRRQCQHRIPAAVALLLNVPLHHRPPFFLGQLPPTGDQPIRGGLGRQVRQALLLLQRLPYLIDQRLRALLLRLRVLLERKAGTRVISTLR